MPKTGISKNSVEYVLLFWIGQSKFYLASQWVTQHMIKWIMVFMIIQHVLNKIKYCDIKYSKLK